MNKGKRNAIMIFLVFALLAALAAGTESYDSILKNENQLERRPFGKGTYEAVLEWSTDDLRNQEITVLVAEQSLTEEETNALFEAAKEEIVQTFLKENLSFEEVRNDVCINTVYQNGQVLAEWSFDSYEWIDGEGHILNDLIEEGGVLVKAGVQLSCGQKKQEYEFYFRICQKQYSEEEKWQKELLSQLEMQTAQTEDTMITLPDSVAGRKIMWKQKREKLPEKLLFLGIIAAFCMPLLEKSREQEHEKKRTELLKREYPHLVSKLVILLGAGMTLSASWKKIAFSYEQKRQKKLIQLHPLYEEMLITCHEIESGVGEAAAFARFGERCGLHEYRKFTGLLTQNLTKGTKEMVSLLETEVYAAFEERKNHARKSGEEAQTKMLFPMLLMFGIVLVIIMVPAMMSFG